MRKLFLAHLFLCVLSVACYAQNKDYEKEIEKANNFVHAENYNNANEIYDDLLSKYPEDLFLNFKAGESFLYSGERTADAIKALQKAESGYPFRRKKNEEAIEVRFYLGQAYHLNYQFEKALSTYIDLRKHVPAKNKEVLDNIDREMEYCRNAIELQKHPVEIKIRNLGEAINTKYDEHSPLMNLQEDMLFFTSNRETDNSEMQASGYGDENIYYSLWRDGRWLEAKPFESNNIGNNATISISPDGNTLLIYQNDGAVGNIYISKHRNNKWEPIEKMPAPINSMANETHASFTLDGNTLYFTSDRYGGFGGKDIYKVSKLPNGEWGKVQNLGPGVNTELDEESPYIHPANDKLYFSSEGHKSMGGYDIFVATKDSSGVWGNVKNIGYPVNTPEDDIFYMPTLDEQRVYYASKKADGYGGTDIYMFEFTVNNPNDLSVVSGFLYTAKDTPAEGAVITLFNKITNERVGVYRPYAGNGKYLMIVPADNQYQMRITLEGYKTIVKDFDVADGKIFVRQGHACYMEPIILEIEDK